MANPIVIECPHNQVTLVASGVESCGIIILEGGKRYYQTYRSAGQPQPDPPENLDDPRVPESGEWSALPDSFSAFIPVIASDLYIYCTGPLLDRSGKVRIDA